MISVLVSSPGLISLNWPTFLQSIVEAVPYDSKLTYEKLEGILLGGLHPNVRNLVYRRWSIITWQGIVEYN